MSSSTFDIGGPMKFLSFALFSLFVVACAHKADEPSDRSVSSVPEKENGAVEVEKKNHNWMFEPGRRH
jgi:hypothetical protein